MLGGIGVQELLLIFLVALLLFGSNKIPEIARSLGKGISEFKRAMEETKSEITRSIEDTGRPRNAATPGNSIPGSPPPAPGAPPDPPSGPRSQ